MNFIRQIERMQILNKLIKEQRTGTPKELAERLGISRSKLYLVLEELRDEGVEVKYSKRIKSFYFDKGEIVLSFSFEIILDEDLKNKGGGRKSIFIDCKALCLKKPMEGLCNMFNL